MPWSRTSAHGFLRVHQCLSRYRPRPQAWPRSDREPDVQLYRVAQRRCDRHAHRSRSRTDQETSLHGGCLDRHGSGISRRYPADEVCRKHTISTASPCKYKPESGGMMMSDSRTPEEPGNGNTRLKERLTPYHDGRMDCSKISGDGQVVATPAGFEPATVGLEGRCSIQLS